MKEYEINIDTLALIPIEDNITQVYEVHGDFLVRDSTTNIIEHSCRYYGSSLEGRKKGTEEIIGVKYKAPIIVEESNEMIFFPMTSIRKQDTVWISLNHILEYRRGYGGVEILFKNNKSLILSSSYGVLDNQVLRSTRLESALRVRKNVKNRFKIENNML